MKCSILPLWNIYSINARVTCAFHTDLRDMCICVICERDKEIPTRMTAPNKNKTPFYLIDTSSPFYKPLWLRATVCGAVAVWAILETYARQPFWSVIAIACAVYCVYTLFISYKPPEEPEVIARPREDAEGDEDSGPGGAD